MAHHTRSPAAPGDLSRRGFSFIELIIGLAIMTMIAATVTPLLFSQLDRARLDTATGSLQGLSDAIDEFEANVKEHPGMLHQLIREITPSDRNSCDLFYKPGVGKGGTDTWTGPYLDRDVPARGVPVGVGIASDTLVRTGDKNKAGYLVINIRNVTVDDVRALDTRIDGTDGSASGTIRWTDAGGGPVVLQYHKPSGRC